MKKLNLFPQTDRLVDLQGGQKGLRTLLAVKATPVSDHDDQIDMVASDETIDRYNEVIRAEGWQLDNYRKNPVIQNSHQYGDLIHTIGRAVETTITEGRLTQRWQFASAANPIARVAAGMYRGGFLHASSVGFVPMDWEDGVKGGPDRTFTKQELLEVSAVGIPANPNALMQSVKSGAVPEADLIDLALFLQSFCKQLADPRTKAGASGSAVHDAHWLQLTRSVAQAMKHT